MGTALLTGGAQTHLPVVIVGLQFMTSLVVAGALALVDTAEAGAALLAGLVCAGPAGYFAWRSLAERSPGRLLAHGLMKFLATVTLMAMVFAVLKPAPLGFFLAFVLMQAMYVIGPLAQSTAAKGANR